MVKLSAFLLYLFDKKLFLTISEAVAQRRSVKKLFLDILQNSINSCYGTSYIVCLF